MEDRDNNGVVGGRASDQRAIAPAVEEPSKIGGYGWIGGEKRVLPMSGGL